MAFRRAVPRTRSLFVFENRLLRMGLAALAFWLGLLTLAGDSTCVLAESPSCRSACLAQYNQCRISSKGSPSCDVQYQACLRGCLNGR